MASCARASSRCAASATVNRKLVSIAALKAKPSIRSAACGAGVNACSSTSVPVGARTPTMRYRRLSDSTCRSTDTPSSNRVSPSREPRTRIGSPRPMSASVNRLPARAVRPREAKNSEVTSNPCRNSTWGFGPSGADTSGWAKPASSLAEMSLVSASPDPSGNTGVVPGAATVPVVPDGKVRGADPGSAASLWRVVADGAGMTNTCTELVAPSAAVVPLALPPADGDSPLGNGNSPSRNPVGFAR